MSEQLIQQTKSLLLDTENILKRYEMSKSTGKKGDFYDEVKPFADEVKRKIEVWENAAVSWLESYPQRNLHPQQIKSTVENLEMVSVQAFFPETSRKRFMGSLQSIEYVLKDLLEVVKRKVNSGSVTE